ncbi:MAG TPA: vitamin K epoxide reductase family protein [Solirubrobacteraceae bacterium]|nr:vitamin K epoxide reductase family protein [Solirubrobacteraceae bacterium]
MSQSRLRVALIALATIGLGVASYLTYVHYSGAPPVCTAGGSCLKVQTSVYSKLAGVPVALIGLIGYVAIFGSLLAVENERSRFATAALTLVGFGFSAYLTYRELFSIHAICEWCASSAGIMTILMGLSVWRFLRGDADARAPAQTQVAGPEPARVPPLGATQS